MVEEKSEFEGFDPAKFVEQQVQKQKLEDWQKFRLEQEHLATIEKKAVKKAKKELKPQKKKISLRERFQKTFLKKSPKKTSQLQEFAQRVGRGVDTEKVLKKQFVGNVHEARLRKLQSDIDRYETGLRDREVAEDFYRRKAALKKRKILLAREFARRNNILAAQRFQKPEEDFDILDVDDENQILKAPNVWKQKPDSINVLKKRNFNILQTRESGNNFSFW